MTDKKSVLFVCLGNVCRSPVCEGICRKLVGDKLHVESASTSPTHINETPDERAIDTCAKHGVDIRDHRARPIRQFDWEMFNVIVALDQSTMDQLEQAKPTESKTQIALFNPPDGIADPFYGGRLDFQKMYAQIESLMKTFLIRLELMTEEELTDVKVE